MSILAQSIMKYESACDTISTEKQWNTFKMAYQKYKSIFFAFVWPEIAAVCVCCVVFLLFMLVRFFLSSNWARKKGEKVRKNKKKERIIQKKKKTRDFCLEEW